MPTQVGYQLEDSIATIAMDDGKVNALSPRMLSELNAALDRAAADRAVVLLSGREGRLLRRIRSAGAAGRAAPRPPPWCGRVSSWPSGSCRFPPPVVDRVQRARDGDGRLSCSCPATTDWARPGRTRSRANEVAIGLTMPHAAVEILRQRLAPAYFNRAVTIAEPFSPDNAVEAGFLDRVVAAAELHSGARGIALQLAALDMDAHRGEQAARESAHLEGHPGSDRCRLCRLSSPRCLSAGLHVPRAKQRTPELRDRVLQVAVAMLASEGVAGFTTRKVAERAATSTPAVYELFGDKAGLVREMFVEGFRLLRRRFDRLAETDDPRADLVRVIEVLRAFVRENPVLAEVMFSRPFADFDPGPAGRKAGSAVRLFIVGRVRRCIEARPARRRRDRHRARARLADAGAGRHRDGRMARHLQGVGESALGARHPCRARRAETASAPSGGGRLARRCAARAGDVWA